MEQSYADNFEDLMPEITPDYQEFKRRQEEQINLYGHVYAYLPLFDHPIETIDKGFVKAGVIELIIPFPQSALPNELPPEMVQRTTQLPKYFPEAGSRETLMRQGEVNDGNLIIGDMSLVSSLTRESINYFARPGLIAQYVESAQRKHGGIILRSIAKLTPERFRQSQINQRLFVRRIGEGENVRAQILPMVHSVRVNHFSQFLNDRDPMIAELARELINAHEIAEAFATGYLDRRDAERAQGDTRNNSLKDHICLRYLDRKWATVAANEVLKDQKQAQSDLQQQWIETQKATAAANEKLANALSALAPAITASAQPPKTNKQNQQNNSETK